MSASTRYPAARPKRAGEEFARTHHHDSPSSSKKPKFDVRNPSALAPDAAEEDAVLEADVIGGKGASIKRNAVNLDGYDSDSENEGFDARAEERGKARRAKSVFSEQLEGYGNNGTGAETADEDDADMFADPDEKLTDADEDKTTKTTKKNKTVTFLDEDDIVGQVSGSKSRDHISGDFALDPNGKLSTHAMDDQESSDDEEEAILAAQEEDVDEEIGAGGLKRNAPKVDAFNMKSEQEEGRFDEAGNFVRKAADPEAIHDNWLDGVSKKEIKRAAEAHEKREAELRQKRIEDDSILTSEILETLILRLEKGESVLEALARLGKGQSKTKKVPKWKLKKKQRAEDGMDVDTEKPVEDIGQIKIREAVDAITEAADRLLTRGQTDIYEHEREMLIRQYCRNTGEDWVEPPTEKIIDIIDGARPTKMWEYRWIDGRDGAAKQGPYDGGTMVAWQDAGYFGEGVEFRPSGDQGDWSRVVEFV